MRPSVSLFRDFCLLQMQADGDVHFPAALCIASVEVLTRVYETEVRKVQASAPNGDARC